MGMKRALSILLFLPLASAACSPSAEVGATDAAPPDAVADAADASPDAAPEHFVTIHLRATTKPIAHPDGWSGETPKKQLLGVRALTLGASANDPNPWTVFDLAGGFIEAPVDDAADTVLAKIPRSALKAGTYVYAKAYVSHVRYEVDAVVHALGMSAPGTFQNVQVLSDGTNVEGATRASGWYSFSFVAGSQKFGPVTGDQGPLPQTTGGGITLTVENGKASYGFPISLAIAESTPDADVDVILEANTHEDFRWDDTPGAGHAAKAFDVDPPSTFEPVKQFGPSSLTLSIVPR